MAKRKKNRKKKKKSIEIPSLPVKEPISWLGIAFRVWMIHFAALLVYMVFAVIGYAVHLYGHTLYMVVTMISLVFFLTMCYIVALRSGYRDTAYQEHNGKPVGKWGTVLGSLVSQCPGFIFSVILQFDKSGSIVRTAYEYVYMPFAYPISMFETHYRFVFFIPLLFAPIIMICAYFTGRMAPVKDRKPSERMMRWGAKISTIFSSKNKKK